MSKVYATMSGFVGFNGRSVPLHAGDEYDDSDALVRACPQAFTARETAVMDERKRATTTPKRTT